MNKLKSFVFSFFKPMVIGFVKDYGNKLRDQIKEAVAAQGPQIIDKVFEDAEQVMIEKITAL
jgi:hypothetical protein